jgi:hypothetical protein
MQPCAFAGREVDGVVVGAAAHEAEEVFLPVRHAEAEDLLVERDERMDVGHHECDVPKLRRADRDRLAHRRRGAPFVEDLDRRALGIVECQHRFDAGQRHLVDA